jgi:hypothetical protein
MRKPHLLCITWLTLAQVVDRAVFYNSRPGSDHTYRINVTGEWVRVRVGVKL